MHIEGGSTDNGFRPDVNDGNSAGGAVPETQAAAMTDESEGQAADADAAKDPVGEADPATGG